MTGKELKTILEKQRKEFTKHSDSLLEKQKNDFEKTTQRYIEIVYEKFRGDVRVIGEGQEAIKEKLDATFEIVGEMKEECKGLREKVAC